MKLYIKRIAQAALITSAVAVAGSAFAMASSNVGAVPANKFAVTLVNRDQKNYMWVFTKNMKSTGNHLLSNSSGALLTGPIAGNIPTTTLPGKNMGTINQHDAQSAGFMLCPYGQQTQDTSSWQVGASNGCSEIKHLVNGDRYTIVTNNDKLDLEDTSKPTPTQSVIKLDITFINKDAASITIDGDGWANWRIPNLQEDSVTGIESWHPAKPQWITNHPSSESYTYYAEYSDVHLNPNTKMLIFSTFHQKYSLNSKNIDYTCRVLSPVSLSDLTDNTLKVNYYCSQK